MRRLMCAALAVAALALPAGAQEASVQDGPTRRVEAAEIDSYLAEKKVFFLDVREPKEIEELGTLEGYYNIPIGELEKRMGELPKDRPILTA